MRHLLVAFSVLGLAACASGKPTVDVSERPASARERALSAVSPERGGFKVGGPYQIAGHWYHPREQYDYVEVGTASWYGPGFHGRVTANGEIYDQNALTAAHRTLQMPSVVKVTNLHNGRSVVLRVNDRGPFADSRIIDVSQRAAEQLGFRERGLARVKVELLAERSHEVAELARNGTAPAVQNQIAQGAAAPVPVAEPAAAAQAAMADAARPVYIQAGSFTAAQNAASLHARIARYAPSRVVEARLAGRTWYRVLVGPFPDVEAANGIMGTVRSAGASDVTVLSSG